MKLTFRPATISDSETLFQWRNDPLTQANALNSDPISWAEHTRWFSAALANPAVNIRIVEQKGALVGMFRWESAAGCQLLTWYVAPEWRGKGVGKELLRQGISGLKGVLRAKIREKNRASQAVAAACGFRKAEIVDAVGIWEFVP